MVQMPPTGSSSKLALNTLECYLDASTNEVADVVVHSAFSEQKWVWLEDKDEGYLPGQIVSESQNQQSVQVALNDGKVRTVNINETHQMNPPKFDQVEDAAQLTYLNEASVVQNLRLRYLSNKIYTYSALFLVAVNPFQTLPMYSDETVALYKNKRRGELPPHIFAAADQAYHDMIRNNENQSILITGESGAGKTESTKRVIQYLTTIASDQKIGKLEQQILQANPILEAFGNAQTVRNKNSSRFGKFIRIAFSLGGTICGAHIDYYLLEKSRVHYQSQKERNYHIFYQLLSASDEMKASLLLKGKLSDYRYLKDSSKVIEGVDDSLELQKTMVCTKDAYLRPDNPILTSVALYQNAMSTIGFDFEEQMGFLRVAAAVLHLGNISVTEDRNDQAEITHFSEVERACSLLGIPVQEFCTSLLTPQIKAGRDWVVQARNRIQVISSLDALAKVLYERSFSRLVERINQEIDGGKGFGNLGFIGVLDIAGFEIFEKNSFEQLCINYTNEKLQQFFNHNTFTVEQEEYKKEGIEWSYIDFGLDLQPTIDLIEKTNPIGILSCLDEECVMPKATDTTFTEKLHSIWSGSSDKYGKPRFGSGFILKHYAANVEYSTDGWIEKNKDPLNENVVRLLTTSTEKYLASLFIGYSGDGMSVGSASAATTAFGAKKQRKSVGFLRTVGQRHREQLKSLIKTLYDTQPHFIRCIVPNNEYKPSKFSVPLVLHQLRCNGVMEGIRIQRKGYPHRLSFANFRKKYEILCPGKIATGFMDGRKTAEILLHAAKLEEDTYKIGLSKVFFKADVMAHLDDMRDYQLKSVFTNFQARCRTYLRRSFSRKRAVQVEKIKTIQKNARIFVTLNSWGWWRLYIKLKPLTSAKRMEDDIQEKKDTIEELEARLLEKQTEYMKCYDLRRSLDNEKLDLCRQLETERKIAEDNSEILLRAQYDLSDTLEELQKVNKSLQMCEQELENASEANQKLQLLKVDYTASIEKIQNMEIQNAQYLASIQTKEQEFTQLNCRIDELTMEKERIEQDNKMHQSNISILKEELSVETFKKQQFIEEHTKYQEEISKLRDLMEAKVDEEAEQRELRNSCEQELESLKLQQSVHQQEIQQLRMKNKDVTTELFEEKQQLREEIFNLEQQRSESEKTTKALKLQVEETNEKLDVAEVFKVRVTDELRTKKSEISDLQIIISSSNEKRSSLERKLTAELAKNKELEEQNHDLLSSSDVLNKLTTEQQSKISHLTKTLSEMDSTNATIRQENSDMQIKIYSSEAVRSKAEKEISVVNSEIDRLRAQHRQEVETLRKSLQENVKINQEDRNSFQAEKEKLQSRISQIEKANCRLATEVEALQLESDTEKSALRQVQTHLKHTETQNEVLKAQISKEQQKGEETESVARQLQHTVDSLLSEVEEKRDLAANLQKRKDIVEQELAAIGIEASKDDKVSNDSKKFRRKLEHRVKELEEEELKLKESVKLAEESRRKIEQYGIDYRLQMEHEFSSKETAWRDTKLLLMREIDKLTEKYDTELQKSEILKDANTELQKELHALEDGSKEDTDGEKMKRLKQVEAELVEWKQKAETEEMARENYQQVANIYENKAKALQSEINQQELKYEEVSNALRNAQKVIDELEQHRISDQEAMDLMESKNAKLNEQVVQFQEDIERITDQQRADLVSYESLSDGSVRRELWEELNAKNSKLEESKRALQAQIRQLQQSIEDYRRDIGLMEKQHQELETDLDDVREQLETTSSTLTDEMAARRKVDTELHDIQIKFSTETARANESAEISVIYKEKAKGAMEKCEVAEIARLRLEKSESILKNQQQELTQNLEKERLHRHEADSKLEVLEAQLREMESNIDALTIDEESLSSAHKRLSEELRMERERYGKEKEEWAQADDSSRRKYQRELNNTASELEEQKETIKRLQSENREQNCTVEELNIRLQEEAAGNTMWRRDKERLEGRISDLLETLQSIQDERDDVKEDLETITVKNGDTQNALLESEMQRTELEQRCRLLQKKIIEEEDHNQIEQKNQQVFKRTIQSLSIEIEELKTRMDEGHDAQVEAKNKAQKAELLIVEAQNENSRLLKSIDELKQQKSSLEKQLQELQKYNMDDMRLGGEASQDTPVGSRIEDIKARLEIEAKSRIETTRTIRNNERVIESQKKALKENEEQISRQQSDIIAADQRVQGLRSELDDLVSMFNIGTLNSVVLVTFSAGVFQFVSEAKSRGLLRSAEREAKEALERVARLERELERFKIRGLDRSMTASPSFMTLDRSISSSPGILRKDKSVPGSPGLSMLDLV
ncbi:hypothetical protein INT44_005708 [Umbelopsis vinacea]|uniref:Uncharacterized protein n=1 Tax=Umbelopsis vinacea TaxID=44442 RepID=A0A8H7PZP4_9FUNG|nr:hypothetical protein INT44_005708 [Umbelopsis vinacea]